MKNSRYFVLTCYYSLWGIVELGFSGSVKLFMARYLKGNWSFRPRSLVHPIVARGKSSDPKLIFDILVRKEYPCPDEKVDLIIDAGANCGLAAAYFASAYPNASIVALEPEASNVTILRENIAEYPNVIVFEAALWPRETRVSIVDPEKEKWGFSVREGDKEDISTVTLPNLIDEYSSVNSGKIIVKMDVEGAEKDIFEAPCEWLKRTDYLFIEIHNHWKTVFRALDPFDFDAWIRQENLIVKFKRQ